MSEKAMQELRRRGARRLNEIDMFGDSDDEMKFSKTLKRFDAFAEVMQRTIYKIIMPLFLGGDLVFS